MQTEPEVVVVVPSSPVDFTLSVVLLYVAFFALCVSIFVVAFVLGQHQDELDKDWRGFVKNEPLVMMGVTVVMLSCIYLNNF